MLAAHADQENLAAAHRQAAAAKPLNAGSRAFGAKTPANKPPKTPFRVPLNDENGTIRAGKAALNTFGNGAESQLLPTGKKGGKADSNAFVTPAGPRTRAPLGMKTTNAKAAAFATPAPHTEPDSGAKSSGPRLRRPKVKVHQASPAVELAQDEERDIEYMPPRETPLPDDPEDWPADMKYPQLQGKNLMRGVYEVYYDPIDDDGVRLSDRRIAEQRAKINARHEALLQKNIEETLGPLTDEERELFGFTLAPKPAPKSQPGAVRPASVTSTSKPTAASSRRPLSAAAASRPAGVTSRAVASALANTPESTASMRAHARSRSALSATAPPANAQPRQRPIAPAAPEPSNPSSMRHQAATAASRTTLGYGKGRTIGTSVRKPLGASSGNQQRSISQGTTGLGNASARPAAPARPRSAWSRHDPDMTLVADAQSRDENDDPEMEMIREMALRNLRLNDRLDGDDWFSQAQSGNLAFDIADEEDDFQFTISED